VTMLRFPLISTLAIRRGFRTSAAASARLVANAEEAVGQIKDGARLMVGGFGLCGIPENSIRAIERVGQKRLTIISNNAGIDDKGVGLLLKQRRVKRIIGSYV